MTSAADEIRAKHPEAIARGEEQAKAAMAASEREPVYRPPPPPPSLEDEDVPDWVKRYGPKRKKTDGPD